MALTSIFLMKDIRIIQKKHSVNIPIVIIHNRKCGGTTLNSYFQSNDYKTVSLTHHRDDINLNYYGWQTGIDYTGDHLLDFYKSVNICAKGQAVPGLYYTGHVSVRHEIFNLMPVNYLTFSVIRNPIEHMLSFYRFSRRMEPGLIFRGEGMGIVDFARYRAKEKVPGTGYQYAHFAPSLSEGKQSADEAVDYIDKNITFFGITENMADFFYIINFMLPIQKKLIYMRHNITDSVPLDSADNKQGVLMSDDRPSSQEIEQLSEILRDDIEFYEKCVNLYKIKRKRILNYVGISEEQALLEIENFKGDVS